MKTMHILWQRLVDEGGQTCDRCGTTEKALDEAVEKLMRSLKALDIEIVYEKQALSLSTFLNNPLQSNRIWIAGSPIEKWLSATPGQSKCCSVCGDSDCRTMTVDGITYEAIPTELIVKAGLIAAAQLLHRESSDSCCSTTALSNAHGCCRASSDCPEQTDL